MIKHLKAIAMSLPLSLAVAPAFADGETIAVFTKNQTNPFFEAVRIGADKAAKSLNATTIHYIPTKPDSIPEQTSQVEDVIVKKPSAVLFTPVDAHALVPAIEQMNQASIPVVIVTDRAAGGESVGFVGSDDYTLGLETARYILKTLGGKGNVIILEGVNGTVTNTDRVRGFHDALKEYPDVKLLASQPANYQRLQALQVMENLLQTHASIDGVIAANDPMATGAIEALQGANRTAQVVGINGSKEAVEAIIEGKMLATGDYNGFMQGCIGAANAIRAARGEATLKEVVLKAQVVDKVNAAAYNVPLADRECPEWAEVEKLASR